MIKALHKAEEVSYESVLFSSAFKGDEKALHGLQRAGFITIVRRTEKVASDDPHALPVTQQKLYVRHARPVFREAFARLVQDHSLGSGIELLDLEADDKKTEELLMKAEAELRDVMELMASARQNSQRQVATALEPRAASLSAIIAKHAKVLDDHRGRRHDLESLISSRASHAE